MGLQMGSLVSRRLFGLGAIQVVKHWSLTAWWRGSSNPPVLSLTPPRSTSILFSLSFHKLAVFPAAFFFIRSGLTDILRILPAADAPAGSCCRHCLGKNLLLPKNLYPPAGPTLPTIPPRADSKECSNLVSWLRMEDRINFWGRYFWAETRGWNEVWPQV